MNEYIEREAALALVQPDEPTDEKAGITIATAKKLVRSILKNTPAADVVPVVRCRDCKHFNRERMECENEAVSTDYEGGAQYSLNFDLDDFCSYGERKGGECG